MSILARQSIKFSIISYLGFGIGTLSSIFIYPYDFEFYGNMQFILSSSDLIVPFLMLGSGATIVQFNPVLKDNHQHKSLFTFSFRLIIFNGIILSLLFWIVSLFFPAIQTTDFYAVAIYVFPLSLIVSLSTLLVKYISNMQRIVVPAIFTNLLPKIGSIMAFVLFFWLSWTFQGSILVFIFFFLLGLIGLSIYLHKLEKKPYHNDFQFIKNKELFNEIIRYSLFSVIGTLGSLLALRIDKFMIGELLTPQSVGTYSTILALLTIISIPTLGLYSIAGPFISEYVKTKNYTALNQLYQKASLNLFFFASLLLCMLWGGADGLFGLMKNGHQLADIHLVLYIIGVALLFDIATGFNNHILTYSEYYKYNMWTVFCLGILTIILDYIFIVWFKLGVIGVAYATLIAMVIYNTVKCIFIYQKMDIQPFTKKYLIIIIMIIIALLIIKYIPDSKNNWINLIFKPGLIFMEFFIINLFYPVLPLNKLSTSNWKNFLMGKS